jgi:hypothetical protein
MPTEARHLEAPAPPKGPFPVYGAHHNTLSYPAGAEGVDGTGMVGTPKFDVFLVQFIRLRTLQGLSVLNPFGPQRARARSPSPEEVPRVEVPAFGSLFPHPS